VLVERFVRAVCDRGLDVDSILVITYTRRAAGELRTRIRAALGERGRQDLARELDGAWISTIHGFCLRLLKAYPFAAGLDPRFRELDQSLWRDLEAVVRSECESELTLVPRRFEVLFGGERAAPELQRGLDLGDGLTLSGKIDRIDVDPFGARGIVQDYKSGKHAHSAREIESELRLQIPLYMLVLRDLVGLEPLGGLYRPLAGERKARGLLRASEGDTLKGYSRNDYLEEEAFWGAVDRARETARVLAGRIRGGDVVHDPKGGDCPPWCDLWTICRVPRA
jgi:ATP-dependent exoDNAse (exonuclease V) beta subunit